VRPVFGLILSSYRAHLSPTILSCGLGGGFTYGWIKQTAADTVEGPNIGHQAESENNGDEHEIGRIGQWKRAASWRGWCWRVGDLSTGKGQEEE